MASASTRPALWADQYRIVFGRYLTLSRRNPTTLLISAVQPLIYLLLFGPVLTVIKAKDFDDALHIANDTEYGLTGSLYSRDQQRIERAKEEYYVGNLYFNRKSTGALVGVHPFGGFNMSGTDSKAGGPDYLLLFTQAKAISAKK